MLLDRMGKNFVQAIASAESGSPASTCNTALPSPCVYAAMCACGITVAGTPRFGACRLEWIVIWLIVIEVIVGLLECASILGFVKEKHGDVGLEELRIQH